MKFIRIFAGMIMLAPFASQIGRAAGLQPHRAVYDLSLLRSAPNARIATVGGRAVFEVTGSRCSGWTSSFRMVTLIRSAQPSSKTIDLQSSSFETGDGHSFNFNQKQYIDNRLIEENKVSIERANVAEAGKGVLTLPKKSEFTLAGGILFPNQHQEALIAAALKNEHRVMVQMFDGSAGETVMDVSAIIGPERPKPSAEDVALGLKAFEGQKSWPVSLAYFKQGAAGDTPDFQMGMTLYENGIASGLTFDYGDMSLSGTLTKLEVLPQESCP